MNRHFIKEDTQMSNKHTKRCEPLGKCKFKPQSYYYTSVGMANVKIVLIIISDNEEVEKRESLCTVDGNVNWYSHYGKKYGISSKY